MPARTDNVDDPALASSLLLMRRGQAYWARKLSELPDRDFDAPSLLPGWKRRHLIAHVGFNARAVARLVDWAATGVENPMYRSDDERGEEISFGSTLPVEALRNLCAHAAVHLNVMWRDLPAERWNAQVRTAQGRTVPASETVWMRTREVWLHAVDLDNGGSVRDFPTQLHDLLLDDLIKVWRRKRHEGDRDIVLAPTDRDMRLSIQDGHGDAMVVAGTAADLVAWGTGRGSAGVTVEGAQAPSAPTWL